MNTLAEPPEVPAAFLVAKVRAFVDEAGTAGKRSSQTFEVLTPPVALKKILRRVFLGEGKDRYYPEKE